MIIQKLQQFGKHLLHTEACVQKLTLSACLGIFIAFSPFVGLHTLMAIVLAWLLSFNMVITLLVSSLINNPWTMIPVYSCDYIFGKWLCWICKTDFTLMPHFFSSLCDPIAYYIGLSAHVLWVFFIGGNILSILLAIIMYHPIKWMLSRCIQVKGL